MLCQLSYVRARVILSRDAEIGLRRDDEGNDGVRPARRRWFA
jgi:hypothetical protein